ncbi:helix-hairpin-helix domain-containing protein [Chloroflexota bacterium]
MGSKRKRSMLRKFGSIRAIQEAPLEELAAAAGMNRNLAKKIKESL